MAYDGLIRLLNVNSYPFIRKMKLSPHNIVLLFKLIVFLFIMYSTHVIKEELVVESLRDLMQLEEFLDF